MATKTDIDEALHEVKSEQAKQYADQHGLHFFQVSAKTGNNVQAMVYELTTLLI